MFTQTQIADLRKAYQGIERVHENYLPRFHKALSRMDNETLKQVISEKIRWISRLAINEKIRRGA